MRDIKRTYAINIASAARKSCEENGVIESNKIKLTIDDMKKVVEFFGGDLIESDRNLEYFEKKGEDSFSIYYFSESNSKWQPTSVLAILNALGKTFFELEKMKDNDIRIYSENSLCVAEGEDLEDAIMANCFALEFLMPRKLFETIVIKHWEDNVVNCNRVAEEFGIDYMHILSRGNDLNIWSSNSKILEKL